MPGTRPNGFAVPDQCDPVASEKIKAQNDLMCRLRDEARANAETMKLSLLSEHYSLQHGDFRALALALARDFVPGFQFKDPLRYLRHPGPQFEERSGRPTVWDTDRLLRLLNDVESLKTRESVNDREALVRLARRKEWAAPERHRGDLHQWRETLESRLQDAKQLRRRVAKLEADFAELSGSIITEDKTPNSGNPSDVC
jgi:hypothetical protein